MLKFRKYESTTIYVKYEALSDSCHWKLHELIQKILQQKYWGTQNILWDNDLDT